MTATFAPGVVDNVVSALIAGGETLVSSLSIHTGLHVRVIRDVLTSLVNRGTVLTRNGEINGHPVLYYRVPCGRTNAIPPEFDGDSVCILNYGHTGSCVAGMVSDGRP